MHQGLQQAVGETLVGLVLLPQLPRGRLQQTVWGQQQWQDVLDWQGGVGKGTGEGIWGRVTTTLAAVGGSGGKGPAGAGRVVLAGAEAGQALASLLLIESKQG